MDVAAPIRHALFFADVHLDAREPARTERFVAFLDAAAREGYERAFCLGDLFHAWIGPRQAESEEARPVLDALARLARSGARLTLFHGNRDFHLGEEMLRATGADAVVPDACTIALAHPDGRPRALYLAHGDLLCARDGAYRAMRRVIRSRPARRLYLSLPLGAASAIAGGMAGASRTVVARKSQRTLSLAASAVRRAFRRSGADAAVVGHVHRAGRTGLEVDGRRRLLFTLGSWEGDAASYIVYRDGRFALHDGPGGSAVLVEDL